MELNERTINVAKATEKNIFESVIGIDTDREVINFYSMQNGDNSTINYLMSGYKAKPFSPEFYEKLGHIIAQYREDHPDHPMQKVSIVLSDSVVLTDTVNLPIINKKAMDTSLAASLSNLYGNSSDLKFNRVLALQSKNLATYAVTAMRKDILHNIQKTCAMQQIGVTNVTYAAAAATNAAITINPKIKNDCFIILDIKEEYARIIFVARGKTVGFYNLPFGYKILYKTRVTPEDLVFDHSTAEQIVLHAREKAKAKNIAMAEEEAEVVVEEEDQTPEADEDEDFELLPPSRRKATEEDDEEDFEEIADEEEQESEFITRKNKKAARKLPKFMLRPTPTNREGYMYENFRLFVKWTLEVIASNPGITALGTPETVYVNMPEEYDFLYEIVNLEAEDNGVRFAPLFTEAPEEIVKKNLELYGGFFTKQLNGFNNFNTAVHIESARPQQTAEKSNEKPGSNGENKIGDFMKKAVEVIKKVATYDLTGGKK